MTIPDPFTVPADDPFAPELDPLGSAAAELSEFLARPLHHHLWSSDGARLRVLARLVGAASDAIVEQVQYDRDTGRSWAQIGDDLGITRQAAYQRYAHITETRVGPE